MSPDDWLPRLDRGVWLQLSPLLVIFASLWISAWRTFNLTFNTVKFWEYLIYGWMYAAAVYLICLVKYLGAWWLAAGFASLYLLIYAINASFVNHMGFMLTPYLFQWLSLDCLSAYNANLPPELTPFYASPAMTSRMFVNHQCTALPTQQGLAATYNSHPNVDGLQADGTFETSLVKLLNARGYTTYFLMSSPDTFLNDNVVFRQMGFQHVIGSQTWSKDPRYAPFINDRGLMDRVLYKIALHLLEQNRAKKIFIDVMSGDTHSPYPREDYGSLQYPPTPASAARLTGDPQARAILTGIFRHDDDIGRAMQDIQDRNLLTTNTLVILTADHNFPHGEALDQIPGYPKSFLSRIPLFF